MPKRAPGDRGNPSSDPDPAERRTQRGGRAVSGLNPGFGIQVGKPAQGSKQLGSLTAKKGKSGEKA